MMMLMMVMMVVLMMTTIDEQQDERHESTDDEYKNPSLLVFSICRSSLIYQNDSVRCWQVKYQVVGKFWEPPNVNGKNYLTTLNN